MDVKKNILGTVITVFLLLGALFGVNIMSFIFGNLGPTAAGLETSDVAYNSSLAVQNDSLNALSTYSSGATTQMSVVNITIVIGLLIAIFAFFWAVFIKGKKGSGAGNFGQ